MPVRITAPLRSIAIVLVAIVVTVEVEHLGQIPNGRAVAGHQLSKSDFENATHQRRRSLHATIDLVRTGTSERNP